MPRNSSVLARMYRLKLLVVGVILLLLAILTTASADWLGGRHAPHLVVALVQGVSDVLLVTGAIGIAVDFFTGREKDEADTERTRRVLKELTPDFTDAVLAGFAASPEDLKRIASSDILDALASNALSLRLKDAQFASEIYAGLLAQAIRTPERWTEVNIDLRLATPADSGTESGRSLASAVPLFEVTITWDYSLVPSSRVQKFACVSDRDEFRELLSEVPTTSTWFLAPTTGMSPTDRSAYELLSFVVDGEERPIRRSQSKSRQTYTVDLGEEAVRSGKPVKVRHTLRAVVTQEGHWLQIAMTQPTKGLSLTLDYTDTNISRLQVTDLVSSAKQPWVTYLPQQLPTKVVSLEVPGWLLPQAEVTFIWTLNEESTERAA